MDGDVRIKKWFSNNFELSRGGSSNFFAMEGLRGLAVILVFIVHANSIMTPWLSEVLTGSTLFQFMSAWGHSGVELFFILSGYLIYGSLVRSKSFSISDYAYRRAKRILPTFYLVLAFYFIINLTVNRGAGDLPTGSELFPFMLSQILLIPMLFGNEYLVEVSWSLTYEMGFYIVAPIILLGMGMKNLKSPHRVGVVICVLIIGLIFFYNVYGPVRCLLFIAGVIIYEIRDVQGKRIPHWTGIVGFIVASLYIGFNSKIEVDFIAAVCVMMIGYGSLVFVALSNPDGVLGILKWAPLRYLGNMSYSYYLVHGLLIHVTFMIFGMLFEPSGNITWMYLPMMIFTFFATLVGSAVLFLAFEKKFSL